MKSPYVNEVQPNQTITGVFLVTFKDVRQKKSGDPYLSLTLADRTGELDAKMWDNAAEVLDAFERDSFVKVRGLVQVFQNKLQLTIHKLQPVADAEVESGDFYAASKRNRDEMYAELRGWIARMANPHLKGLLEAFFADEEIALAYRTAPAAKGVHHAWIGGLIEHVLSLCKLAEMAAAHYEGVDFDLLLTGVILHDIGKIRELNYARGTSYSDEGQLVGHISIGVGMVHEKLRALPGFPPALRDLVLHMILSHHGALEFGSPKVPMFAEALLLHHLDNLDSKMEHTRAHLERDRLQEGAWSSYSGALDRPLLKKDRFLNPPPKPEAPRPEPKPPAPPAKQDSPFGAKLKEALGTQ
jgi:3'-5' exoribonuclease